ncbi:E3 ubiquitin-protein ligase RNF220 isoform X1 [Salmo salar]|uniref:E3 ubiquitin-protein ligase RNF220 n=2 Tax=Salmo TaxID=8028 RepID=A0A1S3R108_SALSA|nr:E3 ubiquitin-protein ligase RNF220 isoform X1 [Salmo salar]XP_014046050.1 E3 ubiquitin-protein ligase RNF220 isoform X1 [Salmo salar]|eukprot:XP_014046048.1 PREDICTED: E3 ubiquitin-protein ligase RNF220-like isoform X1 [Salmo salar]
MDLHRAAFKMESSSYLPNPLASPALMVLASTAEASRDASIPCQQPRPFGVPVSMGEKDMHLPFNNGSYTFASMYHRQGAVPGGFPNRDFPSSLLHLHHQFAPPNLDCSPISMLNHSGVGAFRPFASPPDDRDGAGGYQSAFTPAKRLKGCLDADASPHLRYTDAEGKEYDFGGGQIPSSSPSALKAVEDAGKKIFAVSGLLSDRETSSSPEDRIERCKKKVSLYDSQTPICPICQVLLRPGELQDHMEQEMERLTHMHLSKNPSHGHKDGSVVPGTPKSMLLSVHIKREGESPVVSPLSSEDAHHSDRYQTFLRVRANRQTRLNVDDLCWCRRYAKESVKNAPLGLHNGAPLAPCCIGHARIGKMKRRKPEDGQVCPLCSAPLAGTEEEMSRHVEQCLFKREGAFAEDDSADMDGENGTRFEEYEWCGQKRVRATTLLEGGFRGTGFAMCSTKESHDSDADLDVDGDDTLEYGKAQYTEADIIPCSGEDQGEAKEREALRGAVLNGGMPSNRIATEFSKWASDEMPSTSNGESSKQQLPQDPNAACSSSNAPRTCKNSEIEKITEGSKATTFEALKARIRELEKQILRGDRYKCLICMDSYTMPLTSIQCWHVHCEECWLRTLGNKKLCPQCNTITSPGDLRRVYL